MKSIDKIKKDFPIFEEKINKHKLIYLDNSATTQKPKNVINAISNYYKTSNANTHRSVHELASRATIQLEAARGTVAKFIGADVEEIIFTSGTTDSLNKLALSLQSIINKGDEIILTEMEHHSNIVPWQQIAEKTGATIKWLEITKDFRLDLTTLKKMITKRTKILSLTQVSNVLGTINPIKAIITNAKNINPEIITVIDAAQSVPHIKVDVKELGCDFLAFSGHKTLGPTGIGVLYGRRELLTKMSPFSFGGGMILEVTKQKSSWNDIPYKFEAGTPNIEGAVGLRAAIEYLENLEVQNIERQMQELTEYGLKRLKTIKGLTIIGPKDAKNRAPMFSFNINGLHSHDISEILNKRGIAIRGGNHCAMPLFEKIKQNGASRASLYLYNTKEEIDALVDGIKEAKKIFKID